MEFTMNLAGLGVGANILLAGGLPPAEGYEAVVEEGSPELTDFSLTS